ncbi:DUF6886 family protein [Paenibacillus crassostreae]|uniref:Uncharacterized protein n=1 Tax=Paenibacillus crassostreae TaxID=1763538 RepID=A0A167FDB5_9BACL|nr:DUF6886 family protein [Paenibacillus crassostreae]OAB76434.1 hypothetical protein PNBC_03195 [Paenibacillus crassostreae]
MKLYHFSEESDIRFFKPRVKHNRQNMPPVVWAIDQQHEFTFYFPRNCPRIVYTRTEGISDEDNNKFFGLTDSNIVITVEGVWYKRISETTIFRYELPGDSFKLFDEFAGYYISKETIYPIDIKPIDKLIERLADLNIEIRFTPNLHPLRESILNSTIKDFGIHRFENARKL